MGDPSQAERYRDRTRYKREPQATSSLADSLGRSASSFIHPQSFALTSLRSRTTTTLPFESGEIPSELRSDEPALALLAQTSHESRVSDALPRANHVRDRSLSPKSPGSRAVKTTADQSGV